MNSLLRLSFCATFICALATAAPTAAQNRRDNYFQWPMGQNDENGVVVSGHDLKVLFNYGLQSGGETHGGVDLIWSTEEAGCTSLTVSTSSRYPE